MIDRDHTLPLVRQAEMLNPSRSGLYYQPCPVSPADLVIMRRIDELHLEYPFAGSRMLRDRLRGEGVGIGRGHVITLMKRMGIEAIYRRPNTSKPAPGHKIYPYLLRDLAITRPNQAWAMDITYIPMARGFVYLAVVLDGFSRRVLSWRLSITMEVDFCIEAVEAALAKHGKPEIFNTDQGSQFTSAAFTGLDGFAMDTDHRCDIIGPLAVVETLAGKEDFDITGLVPQAPAPIDCLIVPKRFCAVAQLCYGVMQGWLIVFDLNDQPRLSLSGDFERFFGNAWRPP